MAKNQSEYQRARTWREGLKLSRPRLAALTGYSVSTIVLMERGAGNRGGKIDPVAFKRYKLACAAVAAGVTTFDWKPVTITFLPSLEG